MGGLVFSVALKACYTHFFQSVSIISNLDSIHQRFYLMPAFRLFQTDITE